MKGKIKIAEYDVERLPIYSTSGAGRGTERKLTVWQDTEPSVITGQFFFWVQIGNGKLHACKAAKNHEVKGEFIFSNQRWAKL